MKYHVQFMDTSEQEALGSDGVFILDGRNNLFTMEQDADERMASMNKHIHNYVGWRIKRGSRFSNSVIVKEKLI